MEVDLISSSCALGVADGWKFGRKRLSSVAATENSAEAMAIPMTAAALWVVEALESGDAEADRV